MLQQSLYFLNKKRSKLPLWQQIGLGCLFAFAVLFVAGVIFDLLKELLGFKVSCCQALSKLNIGRLPKEEESCCEQLKDASCYAKVFDDLREKIDIMGDELHTLTTERALRESEALRPSRKSDNARWPLFSPAEKEPGYTHIAMVVPVTSKGSNSVSDLLTLKVLLSSLMNTSSLGFHYTLYLSYNKGDVIFDDDSGFASLMDEALRYFQAGLPERVKIDFARVPSGRTVGATLGLSLLFNMPTLHAYADGADYFYLVNDDLKLITPGWTEAFVNALRDNPVFPNLGVAGGIDNSAKPQPFIEFPFFHRTHIDVFNRFGANPWMFHNWFEDNWVNDIYIPFDSMFLFKDVLMTNYEGLGGPMGGRYLVKFHDVPCWYFRDVRESREAIRKFVLARLKADAQSSNAADDERDRDRDADGDRDVDGENRPKRRKDTDSDSESDNARAADTRTELQRTLNEREKQAQRTKQREDNIAWLTALELSDYCKTARDGTITMQYKIAPHEVPSAPCRRRWW